MKIDNTGEIRPLPLPVSKGEQGTRVATSQWIAALDSASQRDAAERNEASAGKTDAEALKKLSELLLGYALKQITPSQVQSESGLAFDTWRSMLADAVAHEVASRVDLLPLARMGGTGR
jgi:hypothetical protein